MLNYSLVATRGSQDSNLMLGPTEMADILQYASNYVFIDPSSMAQ